MVSVGQENKTKYGLIELMRQAEWERERGREGDDRKGIMSLSEKETAREEEWGDWGREGVSPL